MKRRDFLERVSELAKGSAAAVTLSKVQIGAVGAALLNVGCSKESTIQINEDRNTIEGPIYTCDTLNGQVCVYDFDGNGHVCNLPMFICCVHQRFNCIPSQAYSTGASGGT